MGMVVFVLKLHHEASQDGLLISCIKNLMFRLIGRIRPLLIDYLHLWGLKKFTFLSCCFFFYGQWQFFFWAVLFLCSVQLI